MNYVLGSRAAIGGVLGRGGAAAAQWWLSGGVSAANAIAVYQPIGAASLAASYTNLANPGTYNAAPGVAPTFDTATGWISNGSAYISSGVIPTATYSAIIRFSDVTQTGYLFGEYTATARFEMRPNISVLACSFGDATNTKSPAITAGVIASVGGDGVYRNGSFDFAFTGTWTGSAANPLFIFARSGIFGTCDGKIQAVAIYDAALSAAQVAAISSAMSLL